MCKSSAPFRLFLLLLPVLLSAGCRPLPLPAARPAETPGLQAGLRVSPYGFGPVFLATEYFLRTGHSMASRFPGSKPSLIWLAGVMDSLDDNAAGTAPKSRVRLSFPSPGGAGTNMVFSNSDQLEEPLSAFDRAGFQVWLQVEPAHAPVEELIGLILARYRHHPCVCGFGVDVEWYRWSKTGQPEGQAVTDAEAEAWSRQVRSFNPRYRLFLKHWLPEKMPPRCRNGIVFIDDSQQFQSLPEMTAEFAVWGKRFSPAPVGFQFGYPDDRKWWSRLEDPPSAIGQAILKAVPGTAGLFWVDFQARRIWPE